MFDDFLLCGASAKRESILILTSSKGNCFLIPGATASFCVHCDVRVGRADFCGPPCHIRIFALFISLLHLPSTILICRDWSIFFAWISVCLTLMCQWFLPFWYHFYKWFFTGDLSTHKHSLWLKKMFNRSLHIFWSPSVARGRFFETRGFGRSALLRRFDIVTFLILCMGRRTNFD